MCCFASGHNAVRHCAVRHAVRHTWARGLPGSRLRVRDWPADRIQEIGVGAVSCSSRVSILLRYTCATEHLGVGLVGAQSVTVRAVTPHSAEGPQYHVLPKDDIKRAAAAGLPPLYDEHDDEGG